MLAVHATYSIPVEADVMGNRMRIAPGTLDMLRRIDAVAADCAEQLVQPVNGKLDGLCLCEAIIKPVLNAENFTPVDDLGTRFLNLGEQHRLRRFQVADSPADAHLDGLKVADLVAAKNHGTSRHAAVHRV
jgi:hypothetical protein